MKTTHLETGKTRIATLGSLPTKKGSHWNAHRHYVSKDFFDATKHLN